MSEHLVSSDAWIHPMLSGLVESMSGWSLTCYVDAVSGSERTCDIEGWPETQRRLPRTGPLSAEKPDNYIWNAQKYAVKCFVWSDMAARIGEGVLVWLDADVRAEQPIPEGFFTDLLGDAAVAYLGRGEMHPETGCVVFRLPEAMPLIAFCREAYSAGLFRGLTDGWTDCHVLRAAMQAHPEIPTRSLTTYDGPWTSKVDAFAHSPLGGFLKHFKGQQAKRELACAI